MVQRFTKQPSEIERVGVNFKSRLSSGDAIASATFVVRDTAGTDVSSEIAQAASAAVTDEDADGTNDTASIKVQSGTDNTEYKMTIAATTSDSLVFEEDVIIHVIER